MKSIVQDDKRCYLCGSIRNLERHHIFGGPNRHLSEEDGMWVWLCADCHRNGKDAVHNSAFTSRIIKQAGQAAWEAVYGTREDFIRRYGKNYLEGAET